MVDQCNVGQRTDGEDEDIHADDRFAAECVKCSQAAANRRARNRTGTDRHCSAHGQADCARRYVALEPALQIDEKVNIMLYTIAVVLLILWVLGLVSSYTLGGFIHILLIVAIVMVLVNIIGGRRSL